MKNLNAIELANIDLMRENPNGFTSGENGKASLLEMERKGICYEIDGWFYLQDEYLAEPAISY
jgi:hypothetical protein